MVGAGWVADGGAAVPPPGGAEDTGSAGAAGGTGETEVGGTAASAGVLGAGRAGAVGGGVAPPVAGEPVACCGTSGVRGGLGFPDCGMPDCGFPDCGRPDCGRSDCGVVGAGWVADGGAAVPPPGGAEDAGGAGAAGGTGGTGATGATGGGVPALLSGPLPVEAAVSVVEDGVPCCVVPPGSAGADAPGCAVPDGDGHGVVSSPGRVPEAGRPESVPGCSAGRPPGAGWPLCGTGAPSVSPPRGPPTGADDSGRLGCAGVGRAPPFPPDAPSVRAGPEDVGPAGPESGVPWPVFGAGASAGREGPDEDGRPSSPPVRVPAPGPGREPEAGVST
ncbi:hypothetical protein ABZW18_13925 [Streptomyces sp. NPDC004647]|uniref:hypothetical protein n=1 Tax=Streptomyces sp. NPDC004647 TaxID=3154671 RepID=UPI0033A814DF